MQVKKIIGIALCATLLSSMTAVTAYAGRDKIKTEEEALSYTQNHKLGVVGSITGWGGMEDIPMTDEDGDGVFEVTFRTTLNEDQMAGDEKDHIEFKVRADADWEDSWGDWDADFFRYMNSQVNCSLPAAVGETVTVKVTLDTTKNGTLPAEAFDDDATDAQKSKIYYGQLWECKFEKVEAGSGSATETFADKASAQLGEDASNYFFFDNTNTGWEKVGAYTWTPSEVYGTWPGTEATQIEGTNVWAIKIESAETDKLIFNNMVSDADNDAGVAKKMQTEDLTVSTTDNAGQVYIANAVEDGEFKTDGEWADEPVTEEEVDVAAKAKEQLGDNLEGYFFFNNANTGWDKVGAYTWTPEEVYGTWPGEEATQIEGTDYWAIPIKSSETDKLIFNNMVSDADNDAGVAKKMQTEDLTVSTTDNAGQTFNANAVEDGEFKTDGEWGDLPTTEAPAADDGEVFEFEYKKAEEPGTDEPGTDEPGTDEPGTDEPGTDEPGQSEDYTTQISDYVFFDNSQTKWDEVYAYWWNDTFAKTVDLEGNEHGWGVGVRTDEAGNPADGPIPFPGNKMTQVPGTDIWQIRIPFGATMIIFNSGKSDDQIKAGEKGYQTQDLKFDATEMAGKVFTPTITGDIDEDYNKGKGVEKTKYKLEEGEWADYAGDYVQEVIEGEKPPVPQIDEPGTDEPSDPGKEVDPIPENNPDTPKGDDPSGKTPDGDNNVPQTGDFTMAAIFVAVAAAALGAVVLATKKKEEV